MSFFERGVMATAQAGGAPAPSLPIDWSTDILFARASAATYWDGTTFTRYASGAPRILGDGSLYVEGARTNRLNQAHAMSASTNTTVVSNTGTDPSGGSDSDQVTVLVNNGRASTGVVSSTSADVVASVFHKWVSSGARWTLNIPTPAVVFTAGATWARASRSMPGASSADTDRVRAYESGPDDNNVALFWGAQMEWHCSFASQLIESAGSATTSLPDDVVIEDADVPAAMRSGAWKITIRPERASTQAADTSTETLYSFGSGLDNRIYINASNQVVVRESGVDEVTTGALTWSADQAITLTFDAAAGEVTVAGASTGNGTTTGTAWTMPSGDVQVGNDAALSTAYFGNVGKPDVP